MIYCPRPEQLNDPQECKPQMVIGDIADPAYWPKVEAWVRRCVSHRVPPPDEKEIQAELAGLTQRKLEELVKQSADSYHREVNNQYRILSLSNSVKNHHLWTKYADSYKGVCLDFFVDPMLGSAYAVSYTDEYPALDITNNEGFDAMRQTLLVKRTQWEAEGEYRMVFKEPPMEDDPALVHQRLQFPEPLLKGIIFGAHVAEDHRRFLKKLARFRKSDLAFFTAHPAPEKLGEVHIRTLSSGTSQNATG